MSVENTIKVAAALAIPKTSLPACRYADENASWHGDAWYSLREMARTGETAQQTCGTDLIFSYTGGQSARVVP